MEVAIYIRVSTEEQAKHNLSIETQINICENHCKNKSWQIYSIYKDEGISGGLPYEQRPALNRLANDMIDGKFKIILVYNINRLGRDTNIFQFYDLAYAHNVSVADTSMIYDYNDINKILSRNIQTVISSFFREQFKQLAIHGKKQKVSKGKIFLGYPTPYGYIKNSDHSNFEIVKEESEIVKLIFDLYTRNINGIGFEKIANYLNERKIQTQFTNVNRKIAPEKWVCSRVCKIVSNPIYKGDFIHFKNSKFSEPVIVKVPAIIDEVTFNKARKIAKQNQICSDKNSKRVYKYKGLIACTNCGMSYIGEWDSRLKKKFYWCIGRRVDRCRSGRIYEEELDKTILSFIKSRIINPFTLENDLKELIQSKDNNPNYASELEGFKKDILKYENQRKKIVDLYREDLINKNDYIKQYKDLNDKIEYLSNKISETEELSNLKNSNLSEMFDLNSITVRFKNFFENEINEKELTVLIRIFVDKIKIDSLRDIRNKPYIKHNAKASFKFQLDSHHGQFIPLYNCRIAR